MLLSASRFACLRRGPYAFTTLCRADSLLAVSRSESTRSTLPRNSLQVVGGFQTGRNGEFTSRTLLSLPTQWPTSSRRLNQKADGKYEAKADVKGAADHMENDVKTQTVTEGTVQAPKLNQRERLKRAVREYGATVIVFHTSISLFTLGLSYAIVSSGIDLVGILSKLGVGQSVLESKLATGASTFVVAYAVHKVFAPVRMACTLTATPFIVRYLRKIGFLKAPQPKM